MRSIPPIHQSKEDKPYRIETPKGRLHQSSLLLEKRKKKRGRPIKKAPSPPDCNVCGTCDREKRKRSQASSGSLLRSASKTIGVTGSVVSNLKKMVIQKGHELDSFLEAKMLICDAKDVDEDYSSSKKNASKYRKMASLLQ
ncbi:unnamed protein product [Lepeophtheirus salmonis]|uniref:(salmon louse) hypothetical protein n=1 Tax=Lepeophtheirus salmonis TaxID=72036 RepID=A0A7R8CBJ6_LEPSM|nr:unnamed protein product [Lepeophtheirus salmonis]CAF2759926.1 unnamed protein product [Lepeophtheirus salmonis]